MALSRLARLALSAVSDSPVPARAEACRLVAVALQDECPDLAQLASRAAGRFAEAIEDEQTLISQLNA